MNHTVNKWVRGKLKEMLERCTEPQQLMFKRMYSHKNLEASITEVLNTMDEEKLDRAFSQVERTLKKVGDKNE